MNCQEVQLQLSGYLEKSLDAIRTKSVETHLSSCPFCRAEIHGLSDCIRQVAELPTIETPLGFTQRVMAHAREIEIEPTAWQRLLAACKMTIPIQAAAMVLIGVLAVLLYQKDPRARNAEMSSEMTARPLLPPKVEEKTDKPAESNQLLEPEPSRFRDTKREIAVPVAPASQSVAQSAQQTAETTVIKDAPTAPESPVVAKAEKAPEKPLESRVAAPRRPTIQAQSVSTASESRRPSGDALGIGAAIGALSRTPFRGAPSYSAESALSPLSEPSPDFEFVVRRRPRARIDQIEAASGTGERKRAEADLPAARESIAHTNPVVEIRWFSVAPEHYEYFRKDLAAEANIESERSSSAKERDSASQAPRELLIKVTILQPER